MLTFTEWVKANPEAYARLCARHTAAPSTSDCASDLSDLFWGVFRLALLIGFIVVVVKVVLILV